MARKALDLIGKTFGRLYVIERAENRSRKSCWKCMCKCGNIVFVEGTSLVSGDTKSCGCLNKETAKKNQTKHGFHGTNIYNVWRNMKARCFNPNKPGYKYYGGRGIVVCDDWKNNFMSFYNWAICNGYEDDLTIERIDVNGNYEPENCRWATRKDQANNTTRNHKVTYNGKTQTLSQWANEYGLNCITLLTRIEELNWPIEKALTTKPRQRKQSRKG